MTKCFALASSLVLVACFNSPGEEDVRLAPAPALGAADSLDTADRSCQVVLRNLTRAPGNGDYETSCDGGECSYVWRGAIDVARPLATGATVHMLYRLDGDDTWWEVAALPDVGAVPGFDRFAVALSQHLFGPATPVGDQRSVEVVAFVQLGNGGRLFDHNRFAGDFDNHRLTADLGFATTDAGVCLPTVGTVQFDDSFAEQTWGELRAGGYLEIRYDIDRLPDCRGTHNGHPAWDVVARGRFLPGGESFEGSVRELLTINGTPTNSAIDRLLQVEIPDGADSVEIWFHNFTGAGSSCQGWDSDFGNNYHFAIWPAADDPRCLDVERETGVRSEDERMAHNDSACLTYDVESEAQATHCELWVDGFGDGRMAHYGIPYDWAVAYLRTGSTDGEILNVGSFFRFHDRATGESGERYVLGEKVTSTVWKAGLPYRLAQFQGIAERDLQIDDTAFFMDVRRPSGMVERLWEDRGGQSYAWSDIFALPPELEAIPYGSLRWAHRDSPIYEPRRRCN